MSTPLEERLRAYSKLLDETAIEHTTESTRTPVVIAQEPRHRPSARMAVVLAVALVVIVAGIVLLRRGSDSRSITADTAAPPTTAATSTASSTPSIDTALPPNVAAGSWTDIATSPLSPRQDPAVVWTGSEFVVWGGRQGIELMSDGTAYDPEKNTWRSISPNQWAWFGGATAWTGTSMVILAKNNGAEYDVANDSWTDLPSLPEGGGGFAAAASTASGIVGAMIAAGTSTPEVVGAAVLPTGTDAWQVAAPSPMPWSDATRFVSTTTGFIAWDRRSSSGVAFDASTGTWSTVPALHLDAPSAVTDSVLAVTATGDLVAVIHEFDGEDFHTTVARLQGDAWTFGSHGVPLDIDTAVAVTDTSGADLLMSFGADLDSSFNGLFDAETGKMVGAFPQVGEATSGQGVAWNGKELLVWGGAVQTNVGAPQSTTPDQTVDRGMTWRPATAAFPSNRVDVGCIDDTGPLTHTAQEWYDPSATGLVMRTGNVQTTTSASRALGDLLAKRLPGYTLTADSDWSESADSCSILRVATVSGPDGASVSVAIWQLVAPGTFSVPHSQPFAFTPPDLYTSDSNATGDRTVVKVLPDGTSVKVLALGHDAPVFGGTPTTDASDPTTVPQPPPQSIDDLAVLAGAVADQLTSAR